MELICPSCEARYQLPQGSIGEKGRQVSCMNCGHHWHAYPPLMLGAQAAPAAPAAPDPSPSSGIQWSGPSGAAPAAPGPGPAQMAPQAAPAAPTHRPVEMSPGAAPEMPSGAPDSSRTEQLAEIRQMLAEVQTDDRPAAAQAPGGDQTRIPGDPAPSLLNPDTAAEQAAMRIAEERAGAQLDALTSDGVVGGDDEDDLRRRIDQLGDRAKPTDVKKIRRKHDRRIRRKKAAETAGSGAFLTGFLLIAIIASVMVALYILKPQIVAAMPDAEGPMTKYVETMNSLRVQVADLFYGVRDWVVERLGDKV